MTQAQTYTVRERGCAAWEEGLPTLDAAHRSAAEALDRGLDVIIVDDRTGEVIDE